MSESRLGGVINNDYYEHATNNGERFAKIHELWKCLREGDGANQLGSNRSVTASVDLIHHFNASC